MRQNPLVLTILGCGTSTGVPLIHCSCKVCRSRDPRNKRLRTSAWITFKGKSILIDPSIDLRQQALRTRIPRIDAVLVTHPHSDHIAGLDELRSFNFIQKEYIPIYGNHWTTTELKNRFSYIFSPTLVEGGGIPKLTLCDIPGEADSMEIAGISTGFLRARHGSKETLGFRFGQLAYLTDCNIIPEKTLCMMENLDTLILDCLRYAAHGTHLNLDQALKLIKALKPRRTFLTHMGHDFDYRTLSKNLPKGVFLAYDGLKISVKESVSVEK